MTVDNNGQRAPTEDPPADPPPDQPGSPEPSPPPPAPDDDAAGSTRRRDPPDGGDRSGDRTGSPSEDFEAARAIPQALKLAASIIAPTTLLTALFAYFGLLYAIAYYRYFGINYTVLGLPLQGYLIMSASTAILPLGVLAGASLLFLWLYELPLDALSERRRRLVYRWGSRAVAMSGLLLLGVAAADALFGFVLYPPALPESRGVSLTIGVLLLGYAGRLRRKLRPPPTERRARAEIPSTLTVAKWASFCLLLGIGLFWAVGSYALRMGSQDARGFAAGLRCAPDIMLYSAKDLNLAFAGVRAESSPTPDTDFRFRYSGLKLVPQAGEKYLLLPGDWQRGRSAFLMTPADTIRLEFVVATQPPAGC